MGFEHVDKVLDSWVELGYILKEAKENLKENIQRGLTDRERAVRKAIRDTALFCMTVMIVARAYGLETHPMEGFDEERLEEFWGVDKEKVIPVMLAIGYKDPQKELLPRLHRFKFEGFGRFL
ncbi:nitroreductase family protein [Thermocrinis sp.]|uniref:nitroreductase family protein n=1 Tax=Thermocrinis sp. TaxID=2024383 RepID=UPI003C112115